MTYISAAMPTDAPFILSSNAPGDQPPPGEAEDSEQSGEGIKPPTVADRAEEDNSSSATGDTPIVVTGG
jgi:hypothetical protein